MHTKCTKICHFYAEIVKFGLNLTLLKQTWEKTGGARKMLGNAPMTPCGATTDLRCCCQKKKKKKEKEKETTLFKEMCENVLKFSMNLFFPCTESIHHFLWARRGSRGRRYHGNHYWTISRCMQSNICNYWIS